ncbi:hypothetical protein [Shimia gijangensis]|nr:hypothetical protein [Shimia gijangensis]
MKKLILLAGVLTVAGCSNPNTLQVTTAPATPEPREVFYAKNIVAAETANPNGAKFDDFKAYQLSNGDRVYCGQMNAMDEVGGYLGYQPFYIRRSGSTIKSVHYTEKSADFADKKCTEARNGGLMISPD